MNRTFAVAAAAAAGAGAGAFVHLRVRHELTQHPPRGNFVRGLHYLEKGSGRPVVLLHGLGSMLEDFELSGVLSEAAKDYRAVAFDRPGYGYSRRGPSTAFAQARLLHEAFVDLGISRPVLVAHSLGCVVAIAYALQYPGNVRGLVLASGYYYPSVRPDALILVPPAIPLIGTLLRHTLSPLLGRLLWPAWLRVLFSPLPVPEDFKRLPPWRVLSPQQLRTVGEESAMLIPSTMKMRRQYGKIRAPTVIVAGSDDRYVRTASHSRRLHEELRFSAFLEVPHAGHMVHHAAPDVMLRAIQAASR